VATERTVNSRHNNDAVQECRSDGEGGLVMIVVLDDGMRCNTDSAVASIAASSENTSVLLKRKERRGILNLPAAAVTAAGAVEV
jgi:hypothetical protein